MTEEKACEDKTLLIQADLDGELDAAQSAALAGHVAGCPGCTALQQRLAALSGELRTELPYHRAPPALHAAIRAQLRPAAPRRGLRPLLTFGAGFALAACIALVLLPPATGGLPSEVIADHIRALQPGHLTDVISTDQHTVKPWFDGRLDYAPPVRDFAAQGFPLAGGRLDYLDKQPVAALVYRRDLHLIDLYVWPAAGADEPLTQGQQAGYNYVRWRRSGMVFWAVSDVEASQLLAFAKLW